MDTENNEKEEEISIDFSKIKNFFKRKKESGKSVTTETSNVREPTEKKEETKEDKPMDEGKNEDDEIAIDFSKIKNFFKKSSGEKQEPSGTHTEVKEETKPKKEPQETKKDHPIHDKKDEDEFSIDFSKIKNLFKKGKDEEKPTNEDEISIDWKKFIDFFKKNKYAIPVILILIAIFFSVYFRLCPLYLPITDTWAKTSVYNYYQNQIQTNIRQQYPNLPDANMASLVNTEFQKFLSANKANIDGAIKATSKQFKSAFQYTAENGKDYMYLSDIDTWLWYGEIRNYIRYGHFGTKVVDGKEINFLRNGRFGREMPSIKFHCLFSAYLFKFIHLFSDIPLMAVFFFMSPLIIALSIIPAFFIGRRLGGNIGGFFTAMIVAINSSLLGRTPAGVSDTDPYNILFPLLILWFFLEALEAKEVKKQLLYAVLSGFFVGLFSYAWGGWWYVFHFIIVTLFLYSGYLLVRMIKERDINSGHFKIVLVVGISFLVVSLLSVILFQSYNVFLDGLKSPLGVVNMKQVAVTTLWPNVLTTVAEFNTVPLSGITAQMGENLLFWIGLMGIVTLFINRKKLNKTSILYLIVSGIYYLIILSSENSLNNPFSFMILISIPVIIGFIKILYLKEYEIDIKLGILITIWFLGTAYGFTKGIRFGILMVPAFAIAFGVGVGVFYTFLCEWLSKGLNVNKYLANSIILLLFLLLLVSPIKSAHQVGVNDISLMNDAWYDSLIGIKDDSDDAIITSWWDFGHWFVAISERRVTFDGADQGERIHWVGKSLVTDNESVAVGLLRMLNCGQEKAPHVLEKYLNGDTVKAINVLNQIIVQNKEEASDTLKSNGLSREAITEVLNFTHCDDLIKQYYITSDDMIGKAGVWAHFGTWDFKRAKMWQTVRNLNSDEGTKILREEFNLSKVEADNIYDEIVNNDADKWVSSWPSYLSGVSSCQDVGGLLRCGNGVEINLTNMEAYASTQQGRVSLSSLAFINKEKQFEVLQYKGSVAPYSAALLPDGTCILMDPKLVGSMFTRLFFFDGQGLKHFTMFSDKKQLTGGKIQVWKVSWVEGNPINIFKGNETKNMAEEIRASHILIKTDTRSDEEALNLIESIYKQVNETNFADLAKKYSEDSSSTIGGDLGWFGRGVMVPEFEDAAFALSVGEVSKPIKTQFGYHLIKVVDKRNSTEVEETLISEPKNVTSEGKSNESLNSS